MGLFNKKSRPYEAVAFLYTRGGKLGLAVAKVYERQKGYRTHYQAYLLGTDHISLDIWQNYASAFNAVFVLYDDIQSKAYADALWRQLNKAGILSQRTKIEYPDITAENPSFKKRALLAAHAWLNDKKKTKDFTWQYGVGYLTEEWLIELGEAD